jgi:hypothetical protein
MLDRYPFKGLNKWKWISGTEHNQYTPLQPAILASIHQKALALRLQFKGWE